MSRVRLGDVAKEHKETCKGDKSDYPIVGLEHLEPECITLSQWSESTDNTFSKVFRKGHVLFGRRRAYLKKAAVAPFDGICSGDITVIEAIPGRIIPELLPFVIQNDALFDFAVGRSAGSLSPRVKWEHLKNYEFELPASEEEQLKLADVLWSIEQTRKSYNSLLRATDELVKSQFIELFGNPEHNSCNLPVTKLGELCSVGSSKRIYQNELCNKGIPFLRISDLASRIDTGIESNESFISKDKYEELSSKGLVPKAGDILITSRGTLGKCYIVKEHDYFYFQDGMISWLSKISENVSSLYISYLFSMGGLQKQIENLQAGSTVAYLSIAMLKQLDIIIPPIEKQSRFSAFVQHLDKSKFELEQALSELTLTYKRILADNLG